MQKDKGKTFCNQKSADSTDLGLLSSALDVGRGGRSAEILTIGQRINTFLKTKKNNLLDSAEGMVVVVRSICDYFLKGEGARKGKTGSSIH